MEWLYNPTNRCGQDLMSEDVWHREPSTTVKLIEVLHASSFAPQLLETCNENLWINSKKTEIWMYILQNLLGSIVLLQHRGLRKRIDVINLLQMHNVSCSALQVIPLGI